jgi:hypothetical protein
LFKSKEGDVQLLRIFGITLLLAGFLMASFGNTGVANAQQTNCVRGTFKNYHNEGQEGVIPAGYNGPTFKLSQDYPDTLPSKEIYPWLGIGFNNGAPRTRLRILKP